LWTAQLEELRCEIEGPVKEVVSPHELEVEADITYNMVDLCILM
jgi:hypothetical protein